jgi:hypothetical protein
MLGAAVSSSIEPATSGRAKCRGCGGRIAQGELRLGEHLPNPFAEGTPMTLWFHLRCGAYKRPEALLEALGAATAEVEGRRALSGEAQRGIEHRRLPRIDGVERASTGRARCRSCREIIAKGTWRIALVFYQEGRFDPSGFVHAGCSKEYFGTTELLDRLTHFTPDLSAEEVAELRSALSSP